MDPNFIHEQPGLPDDRSRAEDRAAYLRRLRAQHLDTAVGARAQAGANTPVARPATAPKERRRSQRLPCSGSAEFKSEGSDVHMWGTLRDISLHGCYVEMSTTFPVNTKVSVVLESAGIRVCAPAVVRASYPFLGMGICFAEIAPGQQLQLKKLLAALAEQRAVREGVSLEQTAVPEMLATADPWACVEQVADFFKTNAALSREDFYQIVKRVRRS